MLIFCAAIPNAHTLDYSYLYLRKIAIQPMYYAHFITHTHCTLYIQYLPITPHSQETLFFWNPLPFQYQNDKYLLYFICPNARNEFPFISLSFHVSAFSITSCRSYIQLHIYGAAGFGRAFVRPYK